MILFLFVTTASPPIGVTVTVSSPTAQRLAKIELDVLNSHDFGPEDEDQTVAFQAALQKAVLEGARPQIIPRLLQTVFYDLIREDLWDGLKRYQFPVVDFKRLRSHCILRTKQFAPTLF